jgi:hypothetical protein
MSDYTVMICIEPRALTKQTTSVCINGHMIPWVNTLKYLGVYLLSSHRFKCSSDDA